MSEQAAYEGGYYLLDEPIVKGSGSYGHTSCDLSKIGQYTIDSLNLIQETPWEVNPFILDTVLHAQRLGGDLKSGEAIQCRLVEPLNPRNDPFEPALMMLDHDVWLAMDKEARKRVGEGRRACLEAYEEALGVYRANDRIVACAVEMSDHALFYFPHNMDFRTRFYPLPTDLTPQGNDLSKSLLRFARYTRLGEAGLFWMGVTLASQWGEDKAEMKDRYNFAIESEQLREIQSWVDEPMVNRGWLAADKPMQFLATAHEWVWAWRLEDPESFMSKLPGNLDGSCNGAQHLSIMSRDLRGATATNCRSRFCNEVSGRQDLYMEVADRALEQINADDSELGKEWAARLDTPKARRDVVKRSVMTVPYGVTEYGVAEFMMGDGHTKGFDRQWEAAKYMRDLIMASIDETLEKGRELQTWFAECGAIVAEAGLPLCWDTPAGTKVTQAYRNLVEKRIRGFSTRFAIYVSPDEGEDQETFLGRVGMDVNKTRTATPPNVVHSCDAAAMQITVTRMGEIGIRDFSMIHDSYGCPFASVGLMRDILRQSHVDMYAGNYLKTWKDSVEKYSGVTLPDHPELGEFDVTEILESEFFFS